MFKKRADVVIAIDPGYGRCGVAVCKKQGGSHVLLYSSCITTGIREPFGERLKKIGSAVHALIKKYKPGALAIETLFFNTNQKTAMRVAEVRGVLIFIAASSGLPVYEYTPPQVKAAVAGWGRADKKHMMNMIPKLIRVEKKITSDDEYDAIALGITHLSSVRLQ